MRVTKKKKIINKQTKRQDLLVVVGVQLVKKKKAKRILYHALGSILGQRPDPNLDKKCNNVHPYCPFLTQTIS